MIFVSLSVDTMGRLKKAILVEGGLCSNISTAYRFGGLKLESGTLASNYDVALMST